MRDWYVDYGAEYGWLRTCEALFAVMEDSQALERMQFDTTFGSTRLKNLTKGAAGAHGDLGSYRLAVWQTARALRKGSENVAHGDSGSYRHVTAAIWRTRPPCLREWGGSL